MRIIKTLNLKKATAQIALFLIALAACQKDNEILTSVDTQNVNSESAAAALMNENADIATKFISSLTNSQYNGTSPWIPSLSDSRLSGTTITFTFYSSGPIDGQIIIDFKTGCTDNQGVIRQGQIIITYAGKRWTPGSFYSINLKNFQRNSVLIGGSDSTVFTSANDDTLQLKLHSILKFGTVTFGDGKQIKRDGTLDKIWKRFIDINNNGKIDPLKGELHIKAGGNGTGTNKLGKTYVWDINSELVYDLSCWISTKVYIPVSGEKTFTIENTTYTINYGAGTCDNQVTIKLNGREKTIIVTGDGN